MNANDAERAVLGAILSSGRRNLDDLHLRPEDFYQPQTAAVFDAIQRVIKSGNRPDAVTVRLALGADPAFREVNPELFLVNLIEACPMVMNADHYADLVTEAADRRGWWDHTETIRQMVAEGVDPATISERARKFLDQAPRRGGTSSRTWDEVDPRVIDYVERGARRGIPTPWPDMNRHLGGLVGSRMYTIAARPGEGKSLMAQAIGVHAAVRHNVPVLFASLEMSAIDLGVRIYADRAGVPLSALLAEDTAPSHWASLAEAREQLQGMGLHVNDNPYQSMSDIRAEARSIPGLGLVIIDYLQLVQAAAGTKRQDRREQVDQIARDCKLLAKELDVPVVTLAQMNRNNQQRADKRPILADLRESGAIEQDSDIVILMQLDQETADLTAYVEKNRHGPKGPVYLQMRGHYARITQADGKAA